jgi:arginyl-tRNA synthetase
MRGIEAKLSQALHAAVAQLPPPQPVPESACRWEISKELAFGDLANAVAFRLASQLKQPPQRLGEQLATLFREQCQSHGLAAAIDRVEVKGGYLNVFLAQRALVQILQDILAQRERFGVCPPQPEASVNLEFVSANPTGPLSVAHGRQAAVGDVLVRLLRSQGYAVTAEYYLNDEGRQIEHLGRSLRLRYLELCGKPELFPEDGYHGAYVKEVAAAFKAQHGQRYLEMPEAEALPAFMAYGMEQLLAEIRRDLERFGLRFEQWSSQRWVRTSGRQEEALQELRARGALYEAEEATWFASTRFGDDKDRVVRKRDGEMTYLAPDIAYHRWKFERGFARIVNLWGPDHHGYVARVKAAMTALGLPTERLIVRIVQLVTLTRAGKVVPMSKRQGEFVTFREIMDEVGVDATRFFYLMRTMDSPLDFDLDLAKAQSQENPVYYIQYAHARISSILTKARVGWWHRWHPPLERLSSPEERALIRTLFQYPVVLRLCATALEPHGLTIYLRRLAEIFHVFYTKHRVIADDARLSAARLVLIRATQRVLANGLGLMGISAPQRLVRTDEL